jgi:ribosomal protein L16
MLQPARRKFRKEQKGRNTGVATRGALVSFGDFGLKATERGRLTARQIEASHQARWPCLHPRLPGQAHLAKARRSPDG